MVRIMNNNAIKTAPLNPPRRGENSLPFGGGLGRGCFPSPSFGVGRGEVSFAPATLAVSKSRRDEILLTVDFNLRKMTVLNPFLVPQGRNFGAMIVSSLRDFDVVLLRLCRRLKSTVNRVLSLRDNSRLDPQSPPKSHTPNSLPFGGGLGRGFLHPALRFAHTGLSSSHTFGVYPKTIFFLN